MVRRAGLCIAGGIRIATTFKSNLIISIKIIYSKSVLLGLVVLLFGILFCKPRSNSDFSG